MAPNGDDEHHYHPKDALREGVRAGLMTGGGGLLAAAVVNSLQARNVGAWAVFTRHGKLVASFAAVGGTYEFSRLAAANLREKEDHYNSAIGGFLAGSLLGVQTGRMPRVLGWGFLTAVIASAWDYTGGNLKGRRKDPELDEFERKEQLRLTRRRPIEETLANIGEGRGIKPPGYEERRRERLREKYGIEINPVSADPDAP